MLNPIHNVKPYSAHLAFGNGKPLEKRLQILHDNGYFESNGLNPGDFKAGAPAYQALEFDLTNQGLEFKLTKEALQRALKLGELSIELATPQVRE